MEIGDIKDTELGSIFSAGLKRETAFGGNELFRGTQGDGLAEVVIGKVQLPLRTNSASHV